MFSIIFTSAFSTNAVFGGIIGSAVSWGVRRGVFLMKLVLVQVHG